MVEPRLLGAWLHARSIARALSLPVEDHGGWRVDTGLAAEVCRYVFAAPGPGLRDLAAATTAPRIFIKLPAPAADLLALLPPRWTIASESWVMTADHGIEPVPLPLGYRLEVEGDTVIAVRLIADDESVAASGRSARHDGVFIYDQIVTDAAHRRRGLGRAVMAALGAQRSDDERQLLTATADGRALYTNLGWHVLAPWSTAVIPG